MQNGRWRLEAKGWGRPKDHVTRMWATTDVDRMEKDAFDVIMGEFLEKICFLGFFCFWEKPSNFKII